MPDCILDRAERIRPVRASSATEHTWRRGNVAGAVPRSGPRRSRAERKNCFAKCSLESVALLKVLRRIERPVGR